MIDSMNWKLENCWMILPGHKVGYGTIEIEGGSIVRLRLRARRRADWFCRG